MVIDYTGDNVIVQIPEEALSIGDAAFKNSKIVSISFPDSLNRIGNNAFYNCKGLINVALPNNLFFIGENTWMKNLLRGNRNEENAFIRIKRKQIFNIKRIKV